MDFHALFPLKEKSSWIYRTDRGFLSVAVTECQVVAGKNFFVTETRVDNELLQREKYLVDVDTFWLISRNFGSKVLVYDPPNPILVAPAEVGRIWEWKGTCGGQPLELKFAFTDTDVITVPAGRFPSLKMEIHEKGGQGEAHTERWYSFGIGVVLEKSVSDLMNFEVALESYKPG